MQLLPAVVEANVQIAQVAQARARAVDCAAAVDHAAEDPFHHRLVGIAQELASYFAQQRRAVRRPCAARAEKPAGEAGISRHLAAFCHFFNLKNRHISGDFG